MLELPKNEICFTRITILYNYKVVYKLNMSRDKEIKLVDDNYKLTTIISKEMGQEKQKVIQLLSSVIGRNKERVLLPKFRNSKHGNWHIEFDTNV